MFGIEKTTVRVIITLPDNTAKVQRLYDYETWFHLQEETMTDVSQIADFITALKAKGGHEVKHWSYISDDDLLPHFCVVYEYISK